ncbi:High mobility group [Coemansia aciculifera]|uniref:High mobility group n=1 Tax=Coemansia aciculifera TaxID=417176 RepID=A0A9W8IKL2_9FUNG|nr:High mobility group [Coemansia aciculifera]
MPPRAEDWTSATVAIQRSLFHEEPQAETGAFVFVSGMSEQDNIAHYAAPGAVQPSALSLPPAQYTIQAGKSMANNGSLRIAENGLDSSSACVDGPQQSTGLLLSSTGAAPSFRSLVSQSQQQANQGRDQQRPSQQHQLQPQQHSQPQSQSQHQQQSFDAYYRQQQHHPLLSHHISHPHIEQAGYAAKQKSPMSQVQNMLFDMHSLNSTPPDMASAAHAATPIQLANISTPVSIGNYPLSLDTVSMRSSATFPGAGGNMYGDGGNSTVDDNMTTSSHHLAASSSLPPSTLPLSAQPGQVGSNGHDFMGSPLLSPLSGLPVMGAAQPMSQHGHPNIGTPLAPYARPYNMMFGIPGLTEPRMLYDDRMSLPPLPHNGGNWLRIRQPIDYVAPLKKPMNSFLLYSAERRVQLRQTHPDLNTTQQSTILAREWASLAEEEKEKYRAEAKQLRDDYNARRAELSLKLQQQLNQQHINMSLSQPPPLPPPPSHLHGQPMSHQQPLDMLDSNMASGDHHMHAHPASSFGFHQQFSGSGVNLAHTPFTPTTPGAAPSLHTPAASFSQTPHENAYAQAHAAAACHMADTFQYDSTLSTIDPTAMAGGSGHFHGLAIGRSTPQTIDATARNVGYAGDSDKQGTDSRWREFDLTASDNLHESVAAAQHYGIPRSSSNVSQYIGAGDFGQQRFSQQQQQPYYGYNDTDSLRSNMLNSTAGIFGGNYDSALHTSDLGNGMTVISKALNPVASYASFADIGGIPRIESGIFEYEQERNSEVRDDINHHVAEHAAGYSAATQDPSPGRALANASDPSAGGAGGSIGANTGIATSSKARARLSSPAKRVRKKTKKDPDAPKHPMSAFLYYLTSERPRLAEHLSDMSIGQQTKIIAKQWKTLDENDRAPWEKLAKHDKDRYARERREYHSEDRHTKTMIAPN